MCYPLVCVRLELKFERISNAIKRKQHTHETRNKQHNTHTHCAYVPLVSSRSSSVGPLRSSFDNIHQNETATYETSDHSTPSHGNSNKAPTDAVRSPPDRCLHAIRCGSLQDDARRPWWIYHHGSREGRRESLCGSNTSVISWNGSTVAIDNREAETALDPVCSKLKF